MLSHLACFMHHWWSTVLCHDDSMIKCLKHSFSHQDNSPINHFGILWLALQLYTSQLKLTPGFKTIHIAPCLNTQAPTLLPHTMRSLIWPMQSGKACFKHYTTNMLNTVMRLGAKLMVYQLLWVMLHQLEAVQFGLKTLWTVSSIQKTMSYNSRSLGPKQ